MALNPKYTNLAVNTKGDAVAALLNAGYLDIYDSTGTGQPATADTAVTTQIKLARLTFGNPAFAASVAGVATANAITAGTGLAVGQATWCRMLKTDGTTAVQDGSVGTATSNIVLTTVSIVVAAAVTCSSLTLTESKG
jgi:hypothetical protein